MVTVKLLTCLSGPARIWDAGEAYECDAAEAARLIEAGFAEPIAPAIEQATKPAAKAKRAAD